LFGDDFESSLDFVKNNMGEQADPQSNIVRAGASALELTPGNTGAAGVHRDVALPYLPLMFSHYLRQNTAGASLGNVRAFDVDYASRNVGWNEGALRAFCELNSGDNLEFVTSQGLMTWHAPFGTSEWHYLEYAYDLPSGSMRARIDGGVWSSQVPDKKNNGRAIPSVAIEGEGQGGVFQVDNYIIRLLVDPEPTVTLGTVEIGP
jgi:hypothetical protein